MNEVKLGDLVYSGNVIGTKREPRAVALEQRVSRLVGDAKSLREAATALETNILGPTPVGDGNANAGSSGGFLGSLECGCDAAAEAIEATRRSLERMLREFA